MKIRLLKTESSFLKNENCLIVNLEYLFTPKKFKTLVSYARRKHF